MSDCGGDSGGGGCDSGGGGGCDSGGGGGWSDSGGCDLGGSNDVSGGDCEAGAEEVYYDDDGHCKVRRYKAPKTRRTNQRGGSGIAPFVVGVVVFLILGLVLWIIYGR